MLFKPDDFTFDNKNPYRFISGFLNQDGVTSPFLTENIYYDDNDILRVAPDFDITKHFDQIPTLLNGYSSLKKIYHEKMRVYKGDHTALHGTDYDYISNTENKRMSINIPNNMVNTLNGFCYGIPPKVQYVPNGLSSNDPLDESSQKINDWIQQTLNSSSYSRVISELGKHSSVYGRSYSIMYMDDDKKPKFTDVTPEQCIVVYNNRIGPSVMFAIYFNSIDGNYNGTIYTKDSMYDFSSEDFEDPNNSITEKRADNPFDDIPIVEIPENNERLGTFDDCISAIDKIDMAYSLKYNDVHYFSNALLYLKGFDKLDDDARNTIKHWHILQSADASVSTDAKFLEKPQNDTQQENFIHDVKDEILQNKGIINLADSKMGSSASGDALEKKLQPMKMLADSRSRIMNDAFKQIISIMLAKCPYLGNNSVDDIMADVQIKFTVNIPHSLLDESNIVKNLNGIVPRTILYSFLSNINDVQKAIKQYKDEQSSNQGTFKNMKGNNSNNSSKSSNDGDEDGDYPSQAGDDS